MSTDTQDAPAPADGGMADKLPEELLPVYDWYRTQGRQLVMAAAVLLLVAVGVMAYLRYRANQAGLASAALMTTESVEGMENIERQYGGTRVGPLIRLRLAEAYYNAGNYAAARGQYETFLKRNGRHPMAGAARVGLAATREAEQAFAEAARDYAAFADGNPTHYLYPVAVMGQARCLAAQNDKAGARDVLDRLIVARAGTPWEGMARDLQGVIDRFEGFKSRSIFDQMNAAAKTLPAEPGATAGNLLDALPATPAVTTNAASGAAVPATADNLPATPADTHAASGAEAAPAAAE